MAKNGANKTTRKALSNGGATLRYEPAKLDSLFQVLDALAWLEHPTAAEIAQFAGIDPRTAGKLLKNAIQIGLCTAHDTGYALAQPYPYKGTPDQKESVVRETLVRLPILTSMRQFLRLGEDANDALRKAATVAGVSPFDAGDFKGLVDWANSLDALEPSLVAEDLVDAAEEKKQKRHEDDAARRVAFLSHSSKDKPFVRQLAADLTANGVDVWLDEQRIHVGESIPEKVAQGLAESDFFLVAISENSVESPWVAKELNNALMAEVERRNVHVLPLRIDKANMPAAIAEKKYADFSRSYKEGLKQLIESTRKLP